MNSLLRRFREAPHVSPRMLVRDAGALVAAHILPETAQAQPAGGGSPHDRTHP